VDAVVNQGIPDRWWRVSLGALVLATVALYWPPIFNYLDGEDAWNWVLEGDRLLQGQGSPWAETGDYFVHQNVQRFLGTLTWAARYGLFDLWMPGWHLPGVLLYAFSGLMLAVFASRAGLSRTLALATAAFFLFAPNNVHAITWIGGVYDRLVTFFIIATLLAYQRRRMGWAAGLSICALMSKETGIMVGPILALYWLVFEREEGWRVGVRRLLPFVGTTLLIAGIRLWQVKSAGSIAVAGLPGRSLIFDLEALFVHGPSCVALSALSPFYNRGTALTPYLPMGPLAFGLLGAGVLAVVLTWRVRKAPRLALFAAGASFLSLLPLLVLEEGGQILSEEMLLHSPRYFLAPMLLGSCLLPLAVGGLQDRWPSWVVLAILGGVCVVQSHRTVVLNTDPSSAVEVVAGTVLHQEVAPGDQVDILTNLYDDRTLRLLLSRWLTERTGASYRLIHRGSWRVLRRRPKPLLVMDFGDSYVEHADDVFVKEGGYGKPGQHTYLLRDGGPEDGHRLEAIAWAPQEEKTLRGEPVEHIWNWSGIDTQIPIVTDFHSTDPSMAIGSIRFTLHERSDKPLGRHHEPALWSGDTRFVPAEVYGFRIHYLATGCERKMNDREYEYPYAELHWQAKGGDPSMSYVSVPIIADGVPRHTDVVLAIDPIWRGAKRIKRIGFWPLNDKGTLTLLAIEVLPAKRPDVAR